VLKSLAMGLDKLQGEDHCYLGTLLPTLETINKKVKAVKPNLSSATVGLVDCIEFKLPKFKLKWVESQKKKNEYKQMLLQAMLEQSNDEVEATPETQEESRGSKSKKGDSFFDFDNDEKSPQVNVEVEANDYLRSAKSIECLHKYPTIEKLFCMFNTVLPSSAPVERLFSLGGTAKRNRLTNSRFEKLLLMRYNKDFLDI